MVNATLPKNRTLYTFEEGNFRFLDIETRTTYRVFHVSSAQREVRIGQ